MLGGHGLAFDSVLLLLIILIDDEKNLSEGSSTELFADFEFFEYDFALIMGIDLPSSVFCLLFM